MSLLVPTQRDGVNGPSTEIASSGMSDRNRATHLPHPFEPRPIGSFGSAEAPPLDQGAPSFRRAYRAPPTVISVSAAMPPAAASPGIMTASSARRAE